MPRTLLALALIGLVAPTVDAQDATPAPPMVTLRGGGLEVDAYLPDAETGYYRGPRFDWSGQIRQVRYAGHTFFGPWKEPHDPTGHDDATGPVSEFGMAAPLGYDEAKPGDPVLKIGVGLLAKEEEASYRFVHPYKIVEPGRWTVTRGDDWVEFAQATDGPRGWGYRYAKRLHLDPSAPVLTISQMLANTGRERIQTTHYNHNFLRIDDAPAGPDYTLKFAFIPRPKEPPRGPLVLDARTITFAEDLPPGTDAYVELTGFDGPADHTVTATNAKTGARVEIRGDRPPVDWHVWSARTAVCPEPFIAIDLEPGERLIWRTDYRFSVEAP